MGGWTAKGTKVCTVTWGTEWFPFERKSSLDEQISVLKEKQGSCFLQLPFGFFIG